MTSSAAPSPPMQYTKPLYATEETSARSVGIAVVAAHGATVPAVTRSRVTWFGAGETSPSLLPFWKSAVDVSATGCCAAAAAAPLRKAQATIRRVIVLMGSSPYTRSIPGPGPKRKLRLVDSQ